ncbi:Flavonoid 3'-monooxygenase [Dichanthelium oligosanthes]|uniref:Flavonoid 3'-monooxygenase n=1 Tax=Dichanthelium oligosanthes TaxID=888268 RepID=A0A1E5UXS9_9POAL|nr:Flavonoid 3'-monooxygenase [Dichanthelium oligosanthes]
MTSTIVEWSLAELIRHPDILRQAQEELDTESDLPRLTFFHAVIKETFRLHPSTALSLPRMAAKECEGSELLINVWGIARDPALWPDPLEFRPGRVACGCGCQRGWLWALYHSARAGGYAKGSAGACGWSHSLAPPWCMRLTGSCEWDKLRTS